MIYYGSGFRGNDKDASGQSITLNHPRIGWNNVARRGTVSASTEAAGFDAVNAASPWTYSYWKPTASTSQWEVALTSTEAVAACGISDHDLGTVGATIQAQTSADGVTWADIGPEVTPEDDAPIFIMFDRTDVDYIRLSITGGTPTIAVIYFCDVIELPQRVYGGVATPIDLARQTEFRTNRTTTGQWVGRSIKRAKNYNDFTVAHLHETYVRRVLDPFILDAQSYPYFLAERPLDTPTAISYRWRDSDILPERMGVLNLMQVTL